MCVWNVRSARLHQQAEYDDAGEPQQTEHHGDAVEVALGDRRAADGRRHAATEHVGETAALPLVHQHKQHQQQAEDDQGDREPQNHGWTNFLGTGWTTGAGWHSTWPPQGYDGSPLAHTRGLSVRLRCAQAGVERPTVLSPSGLRALVLSTPAAPRRLT